LPEDVRARRQKLTMGSAFPGGRGGDTGWAWTGQMYHIKDDADPGKGSWLFGLPGSCLYPASWDIGKRYQEQADKGEFHGKGWVNTPYQSQMCVMTFPEVDDPRMPAGLQAANTIGYLYAHIAAGQLDGGSSNMAWEDVEYHLWCYRNWIQHVKLDGLYFDQSQPTSGVNPVANLGYVLDLPDRPTLHGRVQPGFALTGIREMFKRLRAVFVENGNPEPYIWIHSTDGNMVSAFAFALFLMEGENYPYVTREMPVSKKIAPARQQAMADSAGGLAPMQMEMWEGHPLIVRDVTGWFMLHDVGGSGSAPAHYNWAGIDVNRKADFLPYWSPRVAAALKTAPPEVFACSRIRENSGEFQAGQRALQPPNSHEFGYSPSKCATAKPEVYASAWRQDNALRVLVYNRYDQPVDAVVQLDLAALGLAVAADKPLAATELEPDAKAEVRGGGEVKAKATGNTLTVTVPVLNRNFRLFRVGE
jgi:hypothetical protein